MTNNYYKLDDKGEPILAEGLMDWAIWFEKQDRIIKQETIGEYFISTVFLGMDHGFTLKGPPIYWETMVFRPNPDPKPCPITGRVSERIELDGYTDRCGGSREQAEAMHERMVKKVKRRIKTHGDMDRTKRKRV